MSSKQNVETRMYWYRMWASSISRWDVQFQLSKLILHI